MHGFYRVSYINIILIIHSILCYKMIVKNKKKMQKLDQFKLLNLFSYQIILSGCVPKFFFLNLYLRSHSYKRTTKINKLKIVNMFEKSNGESKVML